MTYIEAVSRGRGKFDEFKRSAEEAQKAQERLRVALQGGKVSSTPITIQQRADLADARKRARELADDLNSRYSVRSFSSDGVMVRKSEWEQMIAVTQAATAVVGARGTPAMANALDNLRFAVQDLERLHFSEVDAIKGLLKLVDALESA